MRLSIVGRAVRLLYTDSTSLTEEVAAEAGRFGAQLELVESTHRPAVPSCSGAPDLPSASEAVDDFTAPSSSTDIASTACSWDDLVAAVGLWPRPPPARPGLCLDVRCPLVIHGTTSS